MPEPKVDRRKAPLIQTRGEVIDGYLNLMCLWHFSIKKKKRIGMLRKKSQMGTICSSSNLKHFTTCGPLLLILSPFGCSLFLSPSAVYLCCRLWFLPLSVRVLRCNAEHMNQLMLFIALIDSIIYSFIKEPKIYLLWLLISKDKGADVCCPLSFFFHSG